MRSIRAKLVVALSFLLIVAFSAGGFFLIQQKRAELSEDLLFNALSFAELTNDSLVQSYEDFYVSKSFLHFNREVRSTLKRNVDVDKLAIVGNSGMLQYDSIEEEDKQFEGNERKGKYSIERLRDIKPSVLFADGSISYLLKDDEGTWKFVDANEDILSVNLQSEIVNIAFPHKDLQSVVVYGFTYDQFTNRIIDTIKNILLVIIISIVLSILVAFRLSSKLVKPIKALEMGAEDIAKGKFGGQVDVTTSDEVGRLTTTFNKMSKDLKKNTQELIEKQKLTAEIDLARDIQNEMLPKAPPSVPGLVLAGKLESAEEVGGDVYDFVQSTKTDTYMLVADVTGHGVPASLVAAITNSLVMNNSAFFKKPSEILIALNRVLHAKTKPNMFATALLGRWESGAKKFSYCSAGHDQIIHYSHRLKKASLAPGGGIALGMTADVGKKLKDQTLKMGTKDFLVLYTDGYPEAWKNAKVNLGMDALIKIVESHASKSKNPEQLREAITGAVRKFMGQYPQQDDMTMVVIQRA